jgi:hypothetical protein
LEPFGTNDFAAFVQLHTTIYHLPKQMRPFMRAEGNEIRSGLGIIMPFEADGTAVMNSAIVWHGLILPY